MNFAVIGYQHAHILMFVDEMLALGHEFTGFYEDDDSMAQNILDRYDCQRYSTKEELIAQNNIDIVGTSAVNKDKIDVIEFCNKKRIHVMADKPIVVNKKDYMRLEKIIEKGRIKVGLMFTERYNPPVYTLKRLIEKGTLGKLVSLMFIKPHKLTPEKRPDWHFRKKLNGGLVIDLLIHDIDLLRWLTDSEVNHFNGQAAKNILFQYPDFYDDTEFLITTTSGVSAVMKADWHMPESYWTWGDSRIFCTGTEGKAEIRGCGDPLRKNEGHLILTTSEDDAEVVENMEPDTTLAQDFIVRIDGEKGLINHDDILKATDWTIEADSVCVRTVNESK